MHIVVSLIRCKSLETTRTYGLICYLSSEYIHSKPTTSYPLASEEKGYISFKIGFFKNRAKVKAKV